MQEPDKKFKQQLIERYVAGEASLKELEAFFGMLSEAELDALIEKHMDQEILALREEQQLLKPLKRHHNWKYAMAVASVIVLVFGTYLILQNKSSNQPTAQNQIHDIAPGGNKAILTLANGKKISLTDARDGNIAAQPGTQITKLKNGQVVYVVSAASGLAANSIKAKDVVYNTISTPRGGQWQLKLQDGSRVWLNAASSITFPTTFNGKDRTVTVKGEAYFEIFHNAKQPFKINVKNQVVEDIGTKFNINAYEDEPSIKTSLIEGSVKVFSPTSLSPLMISGVRLKPGEQAILGNGTINVGAVDTEDAIDWKDGYFQFDGENLEIAMRKIARWYDVDVEYKNNATKKQPLAGSISKYSQVSQVLKKMELTGVIHFNLSGRRIIVE
jgi:transmembrane sensor